VNKLFRWGNAITERTVKRYLEKGKIVGSVTRDDKAGEWLALPELCRGFNIENRWLEL
jgi:hypothetical protein